MIVGAGAAGLSAAGSLKRRGIGAVLLDENAALGETWARRYDGLHLHTMRKFSGLANYPIPRCYPTYLWRNDVVSCLKQYAGHFNLDIRYRCTVRTVRMSSHKSRTWEVISNNGTW